MCNKLHLSKARYSLSCTTQNSNWNSLYAACTRPSSCKHTSIIHFWYKLAKLQIMSLNKNQLNTSLADLKQLIFKSHFLDCNPSFWQPPNRKTHTLLLAFWPSGKILQNPWRNSSNLHSFIIQTTFWSLINIHSPAVTALSHSAFLQTLPMADWDLDLLKLCWAKRLQASSS